MSNRCDLTRSAGVPNPPAPGKDVGSNERRSPVDVALWIAAGFLALVSVGAGVNKLIKPKETLMASPQFAWAEDFSQQQLRMAGAMELLAVIGLILPEATGILPLLTPLAACGLVVLQIFALATHVRRKEFNLVGVNVVVIAIALFVAVGRFID
jgi:uncharacterized membrane protein YphA (DoxX/SURF4 family)